MKMNSIAEETKRMTLFAELDSLCDDLYKTNVVLYQVTAAIEGPQPESKGQGYDRETINGTVDFLRSLVRENAETAILLRNRIGEK